MRRRVVLSLAVALVVAGAVLIRAQVITPGPTYPLWEYRTETTRGPGQQDVSASMLDGFGRDGWELTTLTRREVRVQDVMQTETIYVFKRSRADARR
jgi:hypothetical protein